MRTRSTDRERLPRHPAGDRRAADRRWPHHLPCSGKDAAGNWGPLDERHPRRRQDRAGRSPGSALTPEPDQRRRHGDAHRYGHRRRQHGDPSVEWFIGARPRRRQRHAVVPGAGGHHGDDPLAAYPARGRPHGHRASAATRSATGPRPTQRRSCTCATRCGSRRPATPTRPAWPARPTTRTSTAGAARRFGRTLDAERGAVQRARRRRANVDGFSRVDATHFYLSFTGQVTLPGLGNVQDEDVVLLERRRPGAVLRRQRARQRGQQPRPRRDQRRGGRCTSRRTATPLLPEWSAAGDDADIYRLERRHPSVHPGRRRHEHRGARQRERRRLRVALGDGLPVLVQRRHHDQRPGQPPRTRTSCAAPAPCGPSTSTAPPGA